MSELDMSEKVYRDKHFIFIYLIRHYIRVLKKKQLYVQPSVSTVSVFTRRSIRGALIQAHGNIKL